MTFVPSASSLLALAGFAVPGFRPGIVSLLVNGMLYEGWLTVEVSRSAKEMAGTATLKVSEPFSSRYGGGAGLSQWPIREGDACAVLYSGLPVVTGYVETRSPRYDAESHEVTLQVRSKTGDLVDSSAGPDVPGGEMRNADIIQMARKLAGKHGVPVKVEGAKPERFDVARVLPGETKHQFLERYARPGAVALTDDVDGALRLLRAEDGAPDASLIEGVNILEASATLRADKKMSEYHTKGQQHGSDQKYGDPVAQIGAKVTDPSVKRYRPCEMLNETKTQKEDARRRGAWEAAARSGESVRAEVKVVDWMASPGRLWMPGMRVFVSSPMLGLARVLSVESVKLEQSDDQGTVSSLSLVPVEALNPDAKAAGAPNAKGGSSGTAAKPGGPASAPLPDRRPSGDVPYAAPGHWREGISDQSWTNTRPVGTPQ